MVGEGPELVETEPNNQPNQATKIAIPGAVCGRIWSSNQSSDVDLFRFDAKAGQKWIIETVAGQRSSPMDSKIEVLHSDGKPVERLLLQAVRNSAVTFRGVDSTTTDCRVENWEEMELDEWLYLQGEVVKLFRAPQGPDSGFLFYSSAGKRRAYFDTSSTAHALDEHLARRLLTRYAARRQELQERLDTVYHSSAALERQQEEAALRHLWRVQHEAARAAYVRGQISRGALRELIAEIDEEMGHLDGVGGKARDADAMR